MNPAHAHLRIRKAPTPSTIATNPNTISNAPSASLLSSAPPTTTTTPSTTWYAPTTNASRPANVTATGRGEACPERGELEGATVSAKPNRRLTIRRAESCAARESRLGRQSGNPVAEQRDSEQRHNHHRERPRMPDEPVPSGFEDAHRPLARDEQHHERDGDRKQRDKREEDPRNHVPRRARVELRDVLQRDRDEAASIRKRRTGRHDGDPRRVSNRAHPANHGLDLRRVHGPAPDPSHPPKQKHCEDDVEHSNPGLRCRRRGSSRVPEHKRG